MIEERTKKILLAIIKHCNIIEDTEEHFGNDYEKFEENTIYQNAILTPVTQIGELVKRLPDDFRKKAYRNTMEKHSRNERYCCTQL